MVSLTAPDRDFLTLDPIPPVLGRAVVPLLERSFECPDEVTPKGTAFVIARLPRGDTLLVTAAHNVSDEVMDEEAQLIVLFPPKDGSRQRKGFVIEGIALPTTSSDVALLVAAVDDSVARPARMTLGTEAPELGANCLGLGYSELVIGRPMNLRATGQLNISSSRGQIEELFPSRRDSVKVTYPSFRTDSLYAAGMSGGPVVGPSGGFLAST
jgi:hypothetical protein